MYNIFDTREPEGDGRPIMCSCGCGIVAQYFQTHAEARTWALEQGLHIDRMTIAPPVQ